MKCTRCNSENPYGAVYCNDCGAKLDNAPPTQAPPQGQDGAYNAPPPSGQPNYYAPPQGPMGYAQPPYVMPVSPFSRWLAFALCFFIGGLGIHRFYVGKIGTGILYIFTGGLLGIGWLVDLIMLACGSFTDASGAPLKY